MTEKNSRISSIGSSSIYESHGNLPDKIKGLKTIIMMLLVLLILCMFMIGYNMVELRTIRGISGGVYYTEEQCAEMFGRLLNESPQFLFPNNMTGDDER